MAIPATRGCSSSKETPWRTTSKLHARHECQAGEKHTIENTWRQKFVSHSACVYSMMHQRRLQSMALRTVQTKAHSDIMKSWKHVLETWWRPRLKRESLNFDAPEKIHVAHNGVNIPFKNWSCTAAIISVKCTRVKNTSTSITSIASS